MSVALDYEAFENIRQRIDAVFYSLGIYVLAAGTEYHSLVTSADTDSAAIVVYCTHIAGVQPSVFADGICSQAGLFVVALHDIASAHKYLAGYILRIFAADSYFHNAVKDMAAGRRAETPPRRVRNQRGTFGHTIADCEREAYAVQKGLDLAADGRAADNNLLEFAAESLNQTLAYQSIYSQTQSGYG